MKPKTSSSDIHPFINRDSEHFKTARNSDPKYFTVSQLLLLNVMCETLVLVSAEAAG